MQDPLSWLIMAWIYQVPWVTGTRGATLFLGSRPVWRMGQLEASTRAQGWARRKRPRAHRSYASRDSGAGGGLPSCPASLRIWTLPNQRERNLELEKEDLACPGYLRVRGSAFVLQSGEHERLAGWEAVSISNLHRKLEIGNLRVYPRPTSDSCLNKPNTRPDLCSLHLGQLDLPAAHAPHQWRALERAASGPLPVGENPLGPKQCHRGSPCFFFFFVFHKVNS